VINIACVDYPIMSASEDLSEWHELTVKIPFTSNKHAEIVKKVIEVDPELQAHAVKRNLVVEGTILIASFSTLTIRLARLTINSFLENIDLVVRTLAEYGDEADALTQS